MWYNVTNYNCIDILTLCCTICVLQTSHPTVQVQHSRENHDNNYCKNDDDDEKDICLMMTVIVRMMIISSLGP